MGTWLSGYQVTEHTGRPQSSQQQTIRRLCTDQALLLLSQLPRADLAPRVPVVYPSHRRPSAIG